MSHTRHYMEVVSESSRKRGRDGDGEMENISMGLDEHRSKRIQCLPLRTSPKSSQQWQSASPFTSLSSNPDDHVSQPNFASWPHQPAVNSQLYGGMEPSMAMSSGRMPTPLQPNFAAQVRGQQNEWAGPGPVVTTLNGVINLGHHPAGFSDDQSVPRVMSGLEDWQAVQNHRRLPSPVSEVEDCVQYQDIGDASMMVDNMGVMDATTALPPSPTRMMDHPNNMMDIESPPHSHVVDLDGDIPSPSPGRRGHMRRFWRQTTRLAREATAAGQGFQPQTIHEAPQTKMCGDGSFAKSEAGVTGFKPETENPSTV